MPDPHPAVAAVRVAVRSALHSTAEGDLVLAGVSGGADSLALLAALAFEAPRQGRRPGVVHVDHAIVAMSARQAERVEAQARALGVTDVQVIRSPVTPRRGEGPEAAARRCRYDAFASAAASSGARSLYLGHSLDDQAEQVLLGLARGSGVRSLAGMPAARRDISRPLLHLTHATLVEACRHQGLDPWEDPSNSDLSLTRNRVRHSVLPLLEAELGPGVAAALARTASLARADADLLDALAEQAWQRCAGPSAGDLRSLAVRALQAEPEALRTRVVRRLLVSSGVPAGSLTHGHVLSADALVMEWHGQGGVCLPGGFVAVRRCDTLVVEKS
ncbi:MAG TPA: tRNA lysidine(34) synthetase TilS [Mycobacteriales bacterium]|nr:tRNA lysidine(34) synthetase TilS [Mycobacteriales bacterium]